MSHHLFPKCHIVPSPSNAKLLFFEDLYSKAFVQNRTRATNEFFVKETVLGVRCNHKMDAKISVKFSRTRPLLSDSRNVFLGLDLLKICETRDEDNNLKPFHTRSGILSIVLCDPFAVPKSGSWRCECALSVTIPFAQHTDSTVLCAKFKVSFFE